MTDKHVRREVDATQEKALKLKLKPGYRQPVFEAFDWFELSHCLSGWLTLLKANAELLPDGERRLWRGRT